MTFTTNVTLLVYTTTALSFLAKQEQLREYLAKFYFLDVISINYV